MAGHSTRVPLENTPRTGEFRSEIGGECPEQAQRVEGLSTISGKVLPAITPLEPIKGFAFVYILQSADGTYYVGYSGNVRERLRKHRLGLGSKHTQDHPLIQLVYAEGPHLPSDAVRRERQLKRWSRAKKEALIRSDLEKLHSLSSSRKALKRPPGLP